MRILPPVRATGSKGTVHLRSPKPSEKANQSQPIATQTLSTPEEDDLDPVMGTTEAGFSPSSAIAYWLPVLGQVPRCLIYKIWVTTTGCQVAGRSRHNESRWPARPRMAPLRLNQKSGNLP